MEDRNPKIVVGVGLFLLFALFAFVWVCNARADWSEDYGFWLADSMRRQSEQRQFYNELERDRQWRERNSEVLPGCQAPVDCYTYYVGNVSYQSCR